MPIHSAFTDAELARLRNYPTICKALLGSALQNALPGIEIGDLRAAARDMLASAERTEKPPHMLKFERQAMSDEQRNERAAVEAGYAPLSEYVRKHRA